MVDVLQIYRCQPTCFYMYLYTVFSALFAFSDIISRIPFCCWWRRPSSNRKVPCIVNFRDIAFSARSIVYMGKPTLQCIFSHFQCIHINQLLVQFYSWLEALCWRRRDTNFISRLSELCTQSPVLLTHRCRPVRAQPRLSAVARQRFTKHHDNKLLPTGLHTLWQALLQQILDTRRPLKHT